MMFNRIDIGAYVSRLGTTKWHAQFRMQASYRNEESPTDIFLSTVQQHEQNSNSEVQAHAGKNTFEFVTITS